MCVMAAQMLTNSNCRRCTLTGSTDQLLRAARTYITSGEDAFGARLEIDARHDKSLSIQSGNILEFLAVRRQTHKDEDARYMQLSRLTPFVVLQDDRIHVIILPFKLDHFRVEAHFHLGRIQRLISSYLVCRQFGAAY